MNILMGMHIAAGGSAILAGTGAVVARKGGRLHARTGTWFFGSMLLLGITAAMLEPLRDPPGSPISGVLVCYFVLTSWVTARRRDGRTGWFELIAAAAALGTAALMLIGTVAGSGVRTPVGNGPVFALAGLLLLAGMLDLNAVRRRVLTPVQRIARHLWRMCFAFFIATGSFFLGQQDVMPAALHRSPILFVLAFAPFAVMAFWLIRLRFPKTIGRLTLRARTPVPVMLETVPAAPSQKG